MSFSTGRLFFWVTLDRLTRLLSAGAYRTRSHDVLVVDTQGLVERHFDRITLSPINSGVSAFGPKYPRNLDTFQGIEAYPLTEKLQSIGLDGLVELVVDYSVPDIADFVLAVEEWHGKQKQGVIWER